MGKILVTFKGNWADEMDIKESDIFDEEYWEKVEAELPERFTLYFGSNQDEDYTKEKYLRCIAKRPLTEEEYAVLKKFKFILGDVPTPFN